MSNHQVHLQDDEPRKLTFREVFTSTIAAALGVQSHANKVRDFSHGNVLHFIAAGVLFTVGFVIAMVLLVRFVLSGVG